MTHGASRSPIISGLPAGLASLWPLWRPKDRIDSTQLAHGYEDDSYLSS